MRQSCSWWLGLVLRKICDSEPPVCFISYPESSPPLHRCAEPCGYASPRSCVNMPLKIKKPYFTLDLWALIHSKTTKAIITGWQSLRDEPGCHGDVNGWISAYWASEERRPPLCSWTHGCGISFRVDRNRRTKTNKHPLLWHQPLSETK